MKHQILFVDDEPNVLQGLNRMLRPLRQKWDVHFAQSGAEALAILETTPCDVIVSDMRMPEMDGAALLEEVRQRHPATARFILSGYSDPEMILRTVGPTHQFLAKPCDADALTHSLDRACTLRTMLPDNHMVELITGIETLPSAPSLYQKVVADAKLSIGSLQALGQTITSDLSMSAKVLQLIHSSFFGLKRHISNPAQAVATLGLDTMQVLLLTADIFSYADEVQMAETSLATLWNHSRAIGICAKAIVEAEAGDQQMLDDAFAAGWLHDIGTLILDMHLPELGPCAETLAETDDIPLWEAERALLGTTHAEIGAYLMCLWGLSDPIVDAMAYHHHPRDCPEAGFSPLTAVHVADLLVSVLDQDDVETSRMPHLDYDYLAQLKCTHRLPVWRECCQQALLRELTEPVL